MAAAAADPDPEARLSRIAARRDLDPALLMRIADAIAALHQRADPVSADDAALVRERIADDARLRALQTEELNARAHLLDTRSRRGRVRYGHGALTLDNIVPSDAGVTLSPGDEEPVDVMLDLATAIAGLWHLGLHVQANIFANRYVDVSPQGAAGWSLLPLFVSLRAADPAMAAEVLQPAPPRLVVIGGLSGTGKSTLARQLGARMGRAPGARILRSDIFRKRLAGVSPETPLPRGAYTRRSDEDTFEALFESAQDHLSCGTSVILDAVFMSRSEREVAAMLADRMRVPFTGLWLEAPERDRIARVAARDNDASDAGVDVAREQSRRSVGDLGGWHRMRVNRPLDLIVPAARAALDRARR